MPHIAINDTVIGSNWSLLGFFHTLGGKCPVGNPHSFIASLTSRGPDPLRGDPMVMPPLHRSTGTCPIVIFPFPLVVTFGQLVQHARTNLLKLAVRFSTHIPLPHADIDDGR